MGLITAQLLGGSAVLGSASEAKPSPKEVAKDVGLFALGFSEAVGPHLGFADCLKDLNSTYVQTELSVELLEKVFKNGTSAALEQAFQALGEDLKDIGDAMAVCSKDGAVLAAKVKTLAAALHGDPRKIVKVVVSDAVHIWTDRLEISS